MPLVKAYPALSKTYGEVSCIAGVTASGSPEWIRLYPVPFRALTDNQRFAKYQRIRVRVETHGGDRRPETRRPNRDSIEVAGDAIPSDNAWQLRRRFVEPLMADSMCAIQRRQRKDRSQTDSSVGFGDLPIDYRLGVGVAVGVGAPVAILEGPRDLLELLNLVCLFLRVELIQERRLGRPGAGDLLFLPPRSSLATSTNTRRRSSSSASGGPSDDRSSSRYPMSTTSSSMPSSPRSASMMTLR